MPTLAREVAHLQRWPTDQRTRALKRIIPRRAVQAALRACRQRRHWCARVPDWWMVWFVIGLGLFCTDCYRQVFRWLQRFRPGGTPGRSTLCQARQRVGIAVFAHLARQVVRLRATPHTPGAFYRGLRLMALDGFVVDLPDTPATDRAFGRPRNGRAAGACPQARVVTLCEVGTHVLWRWLVKPIRRGEITLARFLLRFLAPGMLLLWDRNFFSFDTIAQVRQRGAFLLARVKTNLVLRPRRRCRDGSYRAKVYPSAKHRAQDRGGIPVRILEYTLRDPGRPGAGHRQRLLTTLLDARRDPAPTLIELYHLRWECELAIDEVKTHQRQRPVLRSQTPAGVVQELYGLLLGHYVVRVLMAEAAARQRLSPQRLSFTATLKILRCRWPECPRRTAGQRRWYQTVLREIGEEVLAERRDRVNPRVIKRTISKWPKKRPEHRRCPQPRTTFRESIVMLR
jgi:hypothetical protein